VPPWEKISRGGREAAQDGARPTGSSLRGMKFVPRDLPKRRFIDTW
jgi:hypothetical protein